MSIIVERIGVEPIKELDKDLKPISPSPILAAVMSAFKDPPQNPGGNAEHHEVGEYSTVRKHGNKPVIDALAETAKC